VGPRPASGRRDAAGAGRRRRRRLGGSGTRQGARCSRNRRRVERGQGTGRDAGADEAIVYPRGPFDKDASKALAEQFKAAVGPKGADVIYDPVGGDYCEPALRAIAWEGRYLVVGFPAGIPRLPLNLTLLKSCDVRGVFWGAFAARDPAANQAHVKELFALWDAGKISPRVSATYPLDRAGEAIAAMAARQVIGKLVVEIG
jgi:NADPH:quinone reductase-like Zn-dependent oxidoreductase